MAVASPTGARHTEPDNDTITGNSVAGTGGGLYNNGTTTLTDCTVSGNSASERRAVQHGVGVTTLTNCTVSGNSGDQRRRPVPIERHGHADQLHHQRQLRRQERRRPEQRRSERRR